MGISKSLLAMGLTFLALLLPAVSTQAQSLSSPTQAGMRAIGNGVFLDPELPTDVREQIPGLVEEAKMRVAQYYGSLLAKPNLVFCGSADCFRGFGGCGLGFTNGEHIVISPQGIRPAIIAHELTHVELVTRVGGFSRVLERVPQWFDEGMAVMVSEAEEFSDDAWLKASGNGKNAPDLTALESVEQWTRLTGSQGENMQLTYGTAKREVARWFTKVGSAGFRELLDSLKRDETFLHAYRRIETQQS